MLVNNLGKNKIKITLSAFEIAKLFGSYENIDYSNPEIKIALNVLLDKAIKLSSTQFDDGALFVEVYPTVLGGCNIYFTRINQSNKPQSKFKKVSGNNIWIVLEFEKSDDLLGAVECLYIKSHENTLKSALYKSMNNYLLLLVCPKHIEQKLKFIKEFAKKTYYGKEKCSVVDEHYTKIISDNAVEKIGEYLKSNTDNNTNLNLNF